MAEQQTRQAGKEKADAIFRPSLLKPIMEGNTLENNDVAGFLAGRLSLGEERSSTRPRRIS
jgi:hypothetical protein